jgi:hypothetical protein
MLSVLHLVPSLRMCLALISLSHIGVFYNGSDLTFTLFVLRVLLVEYFIR